MFVVLLMLVAMLTPPPMTLNTTLEPLSSIGTSNLTFSVLDAPPGKYFAQASSSECLGIGPQLFYFQIDRPGEGIAYTVRVSALPCAHATGEYVHIQVWDTRGGGSVAIERVVSVPIADPFVHVYVPLLTR